MTVGCPNRATVEVTPAECSDPYFATQVCDRHIADPGLGYKPGDAPPSHYIVRVLTEAESIAAHCCAMDPT